MHPAQLQSRQFARFVHVVRDPLEILVSNYQYHVVKRQELYWFNTSLARRFANTSRACYFTNWTTPGVPRDVPYLEFLLALSPRAALLRFASDVLSTFVADMSASARVARKMERAGYPVLSMREESLSNSSALPHALNALFTFIGEPPQLAQESTTVVIRVLQEKMQGGNLLTGKAHISDVDEKQKLRDVIANDSEVCARAQHAQRLHGYPPVRCSRLTIAHGSGTNPRAPRPAPAERQRPRSTQPRPRLLVPLREDRDVDDAAKALLNIKI